MESKYCKHCKDYFPLNSNHWYIEKTSYKSKKTGEINYHYSYVCVLKKKKQSKNNDRKHNPNRKHQIPTEFTNEYKWCSHCNDKFLIDSDHWIYVKWYGRKMCKLKLVEHLHNNKMKLRIRYGGNQARFTPYPDGYKWCHQCKGLFPLNHFDNTRKDGYLRCKTKQTPPK